MTSPLMTSSNKYQKSRRLCKLFGYWLNGTNLRSKIRGEREWNSPPPPIWTPPKKMFCRVKDTVSWSPPLPHPHPLYLQYQRGKHKCEFCLQSAYRKDIHVIGSASQLGVIVCFTQANNKHTDNTNKPKIRSCLAILPSQMLQVPNRHITSIQGISQDF